MPHGTLINGTNYGISGGKTYIGGTNYAVKSGKTEISSSFYNISFGTPISSLTVGSSVYMNVNNVRTEFLIIHQGKPSSDYDSSCNGTWLLMKDIYTEGDEWWSYTDNDYANSNIHKYYLNDTFLNLFNDNIKNAIQQIKLPYWQGTVVGGSYQKGSNGLSTKIFLLSDYEVGLTREDSPYISGIGTKLSYFDSGMSTTAKNRRIASYNDIAARWFLRSPTQLNNNAVYFIEPDGTSNPYGGYYDKYGIRPTLILPSTSKIDDNFNVIG